MIKDVKVHADQCRGCGSCEQTCSAIFKLTYKVHAEAAGKNFEKHQKKMLAAYYGCPMQAIELVSDDPSLQIVWHSARIIEKKMISATVLEVRFETIKMDFKPGQYVTVRFKDDVGFFNRAYSIVELKDGILTLAVTLLDGGRGSSFFANYKVGNEVDVTEPKGDFCLQDTLNPKVFIGTGTGLAPLIAMMERCPEAKKTLYFGQRKEDDLFYLERLAKIPNLDVYTCLDFADDDWTGLRGRVTEYFLNYPLTRDTEIYACGSDSMMKDVQDILKKKRHPKNLFSRESYSNINGMSSMEVSGLIPRLWIRHIHVYASLAMSVLFLFFGVSGFLASRPSLFNSEVNVKDQSCTVLESHPLSEDLAIQPALQLAQKLARKYPGKLDVGSVEEDTKHLQFTVESVWANTDVNVDKTLKRYESRQSKNHWAAALVQLHRGHKSSPIQRILVDLASLFMIIASLTGILMGAQSRNPVIRNTAFILIGISFALAMVMIINR
ncbi:MAG: PepSY-associated TM helix domain-containing protein [bacterium]